MKKLIVFLMFSCLSLTANANQDALNETLVRIINQINAIMPLLDEAKAEVEPNSRIQLHIESFEGADGTTHPGVRSDLLTIRNSLIDYINKPAIEPRTIKPLAKDYVG